MSLFSKGSKGHEQKELERRIKELDRFCGSLSEYDFFKKQEHAIMDAGRPRKEVYVDHASEIELLRHLINEGCVGFVRYVPPEKTAYMGIGGYGIPVRKK